MSFFSDALLDEILEQVIIFKLDRQATTNWNRTRGDDLRMLTGYVWKARNGSKTRAGFKTYSAAARDAYYNMIEHREAPADVSRKVIKFDLARAKRDQRQKPVTRLRAVG